MISRVSRFLSPGRDLSEAATTNTDVQPTAAALPLAATPSLQAVLHDASLYLPQNHWFKLIQDRGREMTEIEALTYPADGRKVKTHHINHGLHFYAELYQLSEEIYKLLDSAQDIHF